MKKTAEEKIKAGIVKYQYLREALFAINVSTDKDFQRVFNDFFRMRQRKKEYYDDYFAYLECNKTVGISFVDALRFLYERHGKIELSFTSKMVALVDPSLPIWDSIVAGKHFGLKKPYAGCKARFEKTIEKYNKYCQRYIAYMQTTEAKEKLEEFNRYFPDRNISDVKKVDFILWQDR